MLVNEFDSTNAPRIIQPLRKASELRTVCVRNSDAFRKTRYRLNTPILCTDRCPNDFNFPILNKHSKTTKYLASRKSSLSFNLPRKQSKYTNRLSLHINDTKNNYIALLSIYISSPTLVKSSSHHL